VSFLKKPLAEVTGEPLIYADPETSVQTLDLGEKGVCTSWKLKLDQETQVVDYMEAMITRWKTS
jgi:hypothetical protein